MQCSGALPSFQSSFAGCCRSIKGETHLSARVCSEGMCEGGRGEVVSVTSHSPPHPPVHNTTGQNGTYSTSKISGQVRI